MKKQALERVTKAGASGDRWSQRVGTRGSRIKGARVDDKPTLASQGIDKNLANQGRTVGRLSAQEFEKVCADTRDAVGRAVRNVVRGVQIEHEREAYRRRTYTGCTVDDLQTLIERGETFPAILHDPAWHHKVYSGKGKQRSAERYYDVEELDKIKAMPIPELAAKDCVLFMWAIGPHLPEAFEVIRHWGFTYRSLGFSWAKRTKSGDDWEMGDDDWGAFGNGYWTRHNVELCLLATRGKPMRLAKDVRELVVAPRGGYSEKPKEIHQRIQRLVPGPYLELNARQPVDGWTVWGNEIQRVEFFKEAVE